MERSNKSELETLLYISLAVVFLAITSQLSIPLYPIPITFQSASVMLIALLMQRRNALLVILIYLALGAFGLPIFAKFSSGYKTLIGMHAGYLWGFLIAVFVMTTLRDYLDYRKLSHIALNCFLGTIIILFMGVIWLGMFMGLKSAFIAGFMPFIFSSSIKILLVTVGFWYFKNRPLPQSPFLHCL